MFTESELLQLSGIQHLAFCERQWALIHLEGIWRENVFTAQGRLMHGRAHDYEVEVRGDVRIVRSLRLHSLTLGLSGIADVVEFHRIDEDDLEQNHESKNGATLPGIDGCWRPFPVEYKRGRPKRDHCDMVQLCAQAICLEEMMNVRIPAGALYYGKTRRRFDVNFDDSIRMETQILAERMHELFRIGKTPPAVYEKKCESCSLKSACMPGATSSTKKVNRYLMQVFKNNQQLTTNNQQK